MAHGQKELNAELGNVFEVYVIKKDTVYLSINAHSMQHSLLFLCHLRPYKHIYVLYIITRPTPDFPSLTL